jgi:hypothetical protein
LAILLWSSNPASMISWKNGISKARDDESSSLKYSPTYTIPSANNHFTNLAAPVASIPFDKPS